MTYKTIQFTPKGELADNLWTFCTNEAANGERYILFGGNPQDVVRDALYFYEAIPKKQPTKCGDTSCWEKGKAVKVSLWEENAIALTKNAEASGITKQQLIAKAVEAYLAQIAKTTGSN